MNRVALWGGVLGLVLPVVLLFESPSPPVRQVFWPVWFWMNGENLLQHQAAPSTLLLAVLLNGLLYSLALWLALGLLAGLFSRGKKEKNRVRR